MKGLRCKLTRDGEGGFDCLITVGDITIGAASDDPRAALNAATGLASDLLAQIEAHPELKILLPPQATAALAALRLAAAAARAGRLADAAKVAPAAVQAVKSILRNIF